MKSMMKLITVAAVAVIAVSSFAQGGGRGQGGFGQFGRGGFADPSGAFLVNRPDVQTEIKVTDDQKSKLQSIQQEQMERGRQAFQGFQDMSEAERAAAFQKIQAENAKATLAILTNDQKTRLKELAIQQMGISSVTHAEVQKQLELSDAQVTKIKDLQTKQQAANASLREKVMNQEIDREQFQESSRKNNEVMNTELGKVLTDAQKAKLTSLGGKPFKFAEPQRPGGGGGGRPG